MENKEKIVPAESNDPVNHPQHYCVEGLPECFEVMCRLHGIYSASCFARENAFKYMWRTNRKNGTQDIAKAEWYLKKYRELDAGTLVTKAINEAVAAAIGFGDRSVQHEVVLAKYYKLFELLGLPMPSKFLEGV